MEKKVLFSGFEFSTHRVSLSIPLFRDGPQLPLERCLFCTRTSSYPLSRTLSEARLWMFLTSLKVRIFPFPLAILLPCPKSCFSSSISFQDGRIPPLHNSIPDLNGPCSVLNIVCSSCPQLFSELSASVHPYHLKSVTDIEAGLLFPLPYKTVGENIVKAGKCRK